MSELEKYVTREMHNEEKVIKKQKRFKIAFSFPGEYRDIVDEIAKMVAHFFSERCVLYDWFHRAEFARPNLDTYLQNLYNNESELIVVFICADYNRKKWCGIEWRAIRELLNNKNMDDRILFVKCGEGDVDGVFGTVDGYIDSTIISARNIALDIKSRYYSIINTDDANIMCNEDDMFIYQLTPAKLFSSLFGDFGAPIFIVDKSICKNASTFYKFILPQRLIQINPKIWESSTRRSRLINNRAEKQYIEKMFYSLCYEKQMDVLVENCHNLFEQYNAKINIASFENYVNSIIDSILEYRIREEQIQRQKHPGEYIASDRDLTSFFYYLKKISVKEKIMEILSMLIAFSFLHERIDNVIFHYEYRSKHVQEATAWVMPLYVDEKLLMSTYMAILDNFPENATQGNYINYHLICQDLKNHLINNHCAISLTSVSNLENLDGSLVLINGSFLLEDLYAEGQHLINFQEDIFKLLDIEIRKFTFMFSFSNEDSLYIKMFAGGSKFNIRLVHLLQVIYESDRIFPLSIIGYLQTIREKHYSIKPLVIGYDSNFGWGRKLHFD